jgi:hypothetical protein
MFPLSVWVAAGCGVQFIRLIGVYLTRTDVPRVHGGNSPETGSTALKWRGGWKLRKSPPQWFTAGEKEREEVRRGLSVVVRFTG